MSVHLDGDRIRVVAPGDIEDAESLLRLSQAHPGNPIDLTSAGHLHAAVVQTLLLLRPRMVGDPDDPFVRKWLAPFLGPSARDNPAA